jgi:hypothetical protein
MQPLFFWTWLISELLSFLTKYFATQVMSSIYFFIFFKWFFSATLTSTHMPILCAHMDLALILCLSIACDVTLGMFCFVFWFFWWLLFIFIYCIYSIFFEVPGFELRASYLLGRCSNAWVIPWDLFALIILEIWSHFLPRLCWIMIMLRFLRFTRMPGAHHCAPPFSIVMGYHKPFLFCLVWPGTSVLLISAYYGARIIDVIHRHLGQRLIFFQFCVLGTIIAVMSSF